VALASAVAWTLERDEVTLLETSGELAYGLGYADAAGRRVAAADFPEWLERVRAEHDVALFMDQDWVGPLPAADSVVGQGPITLLLYLRRS
jgi:4-amino-4-deoxy-L-arabinose transferase